MASVTPLPCLLQSKWRSASAQRRRPQGSCNGDIQPTRGLSAGASAYRSSSIQKSRSRSRGSTCRSRWGRSRRWWGQVPAWSREATGPGDRELCDHSEALLARHLRSTVRRSAKGHGWESRVRATLWRTPAHVGRFSTLKSGTLFFPDGDRHLQTRDSLRSAASLFDHLVNALERRDVWQIVSFGRLHGHSRLSQRDPTENLPAWSSKLGIRV